jgi:hypothetical protein
MGTNIKGILLTEVNRMREIMGMNVINEGIDDIIKKLLGVSDEAAETIVKGNADELGQYSSKLKSLVGGTGSLSDITTYLSKQGVGTSDDAIAAWIKTQPDILDQIAKSSDNIMKQASEIVFTRLKASSIIDSASKDIIDDLLTTPLSKNYVDPMINAIDEALTALKSARSKGNNPDVEDLIRQLEDKKKIAQNYKSSMSVTPLVKSSDNLLSGNMKMIDDIFGSDSEIKQLISQKPKEELESIGKVIAEKSDSQIDDAFEKIKDICGLKEAAGKDRWGNFCNGASKYTPATDKGISLMTKRILIFVAIGIGIYTLTNIFSYDGDKLNVDLPDVSFGGNEFTKEKCQTWFNNNGYSETTATGVKNSTCYWSRGSDSGNTPFVLAGDTWVPQ